MRRSLFALLLAVVLAFAPGLAFARAGSGGSFGSRGSFTYSAPSATSTAPYSAMPFQRSLTPQAPSYSAPAYGGYGSGGFGGRSPFMSGLMGGLIGAGIGGLLFGHGMFGGITGVGSLFGLLLQIFLIVLVGRWLFRMMFGQPAMAGGSLFGRMGGAPGPLPMGGGPVRGAPASRPVAIVPADFQAFEQLLKGVQAAWSAHDLNALRAMATPEMVSYFAEQLGEQASRGVRNLVTDVRLEQGDLSEAWAEQGREYATVAMRFSMLDVTRDASGRVVDGSPVERVTATEIWTFLRVPGGRWVLSAIQQAR
jgi:predicted lipid-binding transport protein (Tim44 family)